MELRWHVVLVVGGGCCCSVQGLLARQGSEMAEQVKALITAKARAAAPPAPSE